MDQWGPQTLHGIAEQLEHDMERDLVMRHITIWEADRKRIRVLERERDCLLRGIREWDLADAPNGMVAAFLEAAARGEYMAPGDAPAPKERG